MHTQARPRFSLRHAPVRFVIALGAVAALSIAAAACSGDDDGDATGATASGQLVAASATASATTASTDTSTPVRAGGTLVPLPTATSTPSATAAASGQPALDVVAMTDMAPCGNETYFEEYVSPSGVHALTYKEVPEGTPILFPFEEGRLRLVDAQENSILLIYDVPSVGVFSVQSAGASSLNRTLAHVTEGSVIGYFGGTFGEWDTEAFEGYQMFAVAGTEEMTAVGDLLYAGQPLDPDVRNCLILP